MTILTSTEATTKADAELLAVELHRSDLLALWKEFKRHQEWSSFRVEVEEGDLLQSWALSPTALHLIARSFFREYCSVGAENRGSSLVELSAYFLARAWAKWKLWAESEILSRSCYEVVEERMRECTFELHDKALQHGMKSSDVAELVLQHLTDVELGEEAMDLEPDLVRESNIGCAANESQLVGQSAS